VIRHSSRAPTWVVAFDEISDSYDAVADAYEQRFVDELWDKPRDRAWLDRFARSVGGVILDVGCGPGHVGAYLRSRRRSIIGVDGSRAMARLASRTLTGAVVADMRSLPVAADAVNGVVAFYSVIHVQRADRPRTFSSGASCGLASISSSPRRKATTPSRYESSWASQSG